MTPSTKQKAKWFIQKSFRAPLSTHISKTSFLKTLQSPQSSSNTKSPNPFISTFPTHTRTNKFPTAFSLSWPLNSSKHSSLNANYLFWTQNLQENIFLRKCFQLKFPTWFWLSDPMWSREVPLKTLVLKAGSEASSTACSLSLHFWSL